MAKSKPVRHLSVNPRKGKSLMVGGVVLGVIGLFTITSFGWMLMMLGFILFVIGKFLHWYNND